MRHLFGALLLVGLMSWGAQAQMPNPMSKAGPAMPSKAGMTLPPTSVPNRTVNVPVYNSGYYYGYGYGYGRGYGYGYPGYGTGYYTGDTYSSSGPAGYYGSNRGNTYAGYNSQVPGRYPNSGRPGNRTPAASAAPRSFPSAAEESDLNRGW